MVGANSIEQVMPLVGGYPNLVEVGAGRFMVNALFGYPVQVDKGGYPHVLGAVYQQAMVLQARKYPGETGKVFYRRAFPVYRDMEIKQSLAGYDHRLLGHCVVRGGQGQIDDRLNPLVGKLLQLRDRGLPCGVEFGGKTQVVANSSETAVFAHGVGLLRGSIADLPPSGR